MPKTSSAGQADRLAAWEGRELLLYRLVPYLGLAVGTTLALLAPAPHAGPRTLSLGLALAAAVWIAWFITLHPGWAGRRRLMGLYYLGLLGLAGGLVATSPWYAFFAWVGFMHAGLVLHGGWRLAGTAATAVLIATGQAGGLPRSPGHWALWGVLVLFNIAVAVGLIWFGTLSEQQNANRQRLFEELAEANGRLAETMRENEGLHAQLLTQAREAGVLDERQRMAREIHDTLAQGLTGIITQLEAAGQSQARPTDHLRHVDNALALARESLSEARRSVRAVRPGPLDQARLPEVLADLTERWSTLNAVRGEINTTGAPRPLHPEIEVTLLRAAQEALANAARHARATRVGLTLSYMEDVVTLDVRDDGVGFDPGGQPPDSPEGGFGLAAMRQRVCRVGGQLEIESEPGGGTAVSATVPALSGGAA